MQQALTRPISAGQLLYAENSIVTHAIFPNRGIVSLMGERADGGCAEKLSIGREGFLGLDVFLGGEAMIGRSVMRVSGDVTYVPISAMHDASKRFESFGNVMTRYAEAIVLQLLETVLSARLDQAETQIADWLSLADLRMEGASFDLTQDSLAEVLGVNRITVGKTLALLKREGILTYSRGVISIRGPAQLRRYGSESHLRILKAFAWQDEAQHEVRPF